jgi:hypothetical protein
MQTEQNNDKCSLCDFPRILEILNQSTGAATPAAERLLSGAQGEVAVSADAAWQKVVLIGLLPARGDRFALYICACGNYDYCPDREPLYFNK